MTESPIEPQTQPQTQTETPNEQPATPVTLTDAQLDALAAKLAALLPTFLIYRDPPVVPIGSVPPPAEPTYAPPVNALPQPTPAAGDPGPAAALPPTTGRDPQSGAPDTVVTDTASLAAPRSGAA